MQVSIFGPFYEELKGSDILTQEYPTQSNYEEIKTAHPDMIITMGGDGTILNAILHVRDLGIPILGVNLGRLGFLSNVEKSRVSDAVKVIASGDYSIEHRTMLSVDSNIPIFGETPFCLNDFTITKRDTSSMVTVHTYVDDKFLNSYWADGIVVATPTGSTGYSLSVGGPIIFPNSGNFVISPIAPHNLNVRPIVLSDSSKISFEIEGRAGNYLTTLDSRYETITSDHKITVQRSNFKIALARPTDISFMKTIRGKLLWGLDKRN
ncbi:UNVERIFIED_CONTAM: hypothetical protein GTU68_064768 [Idotea baltica]|nr:hypothetical protein [Idotea baltica]